MEPRLFEDLIDSDAATHRTNQAKTWPVSVGLHGLIAATIILLPILQTGLLPEPVSAGKTIFVEPMPAPPPPPPPPPPAGTAARPRPVAPRPIDQGESRLMAPVAVALELMPEDGLDLGVEGGVVGGVDGGVPDGVAGGVVGGVFHAPPPPPKQAIRVGGHIKQPTKLKNVDPVYPDIAKHARVQGVVILECTISSQGKVTDIKVLRGIPLLNEAATIAVRGWVFAPTRLNGVPVPVVLTVTVNFKLS